MNTTIKGKHHVEEMNRLARSGDGLQAYINKYKAAGYASAKY